VSLWWQASALGAGQGQPLSGDSLHSQAYVLAVNVAGTDGISPLLPELVAWRCSITYPVNDMVYGGYEVVRARDGVEKQTPGAISPRLISNSGVQRRAGTRFPDAASRQRGESRAGLSGCRTGGDGRPVCQPPCQTDPRRHAGLPLRGTLLGESVMRVNSAPLRITQATDDRAAAYYVVGRPARAKAPC